MSSKLQSFWWVNHKQTFTQEVDGNYIWSPLTRSDGAKSEFYENMRKVRTGDIIFSFANAKIQAVGMCVVQAVLAPKPDDFGLAGNSWSNEGWRVDVVFKRFDVPVSPKEHMTSLAPVLPPKYSPIRSTGDGNQGAYLAAIPQEMARVLISILGEQFSRIDWGKTTDVELEALDRVETGIEQIIQNRTDIGDVEKLQLVKSRRGQGVYRKNLEGFEQGCRLTGVSDRKHLRASHIKPWRASTTYEKLDGNNGLLLSPHVDHLFDQGYITFSDKGEILVSQETDLATLECWGIDKNLNVGQFRAEQIRYLTFHRESIFRG